MRAKNNAISGLNIIAVLMLWLAVLPAMSARAVAMYWWDYHHSWVTAWVVCTYKWTNSHPLSIFNTASRWLRKAQFLLLPYFANLMYFVCLQDPVDPQEACRGPRGLITQYQIRFQIGSFRETEYVNSSECRAERCSHTFNLLNVLSDSVPSSYDSVSVAAENVVGVGAARTCTTQSISKLNSNLLVHRWTNIHNNCVVSMFTSEGLTSIIVLRYM